jgi:hypothetical protein
MIHFAALLSVACAAVDPPASLRGRLASLDPSHAMLAPRAPSARAPFQPGVRVSPLDFGADPLGKRDSTAALQQCVTACVNYSASIDALGHFAGDASFGNGRYIANAGGCLIDLGGGEFLLSSTVMIPEYIGNLQLGHGSLVADEAFANGTFLLQVGIPGSCNVPQGSCNLDLGFPELFLDGRHVASGLQINNVMGTTVGPGAYFLNCASRCAVPTAAAGRTHPAPALQSLTSASRSTKGTR